MPKIIDLKRKVTLLRYNDSGTAMVWLEGGEDKSPVIQVDLLTGIDINTVARGVANEKHPENESKARYTARRLTTQAMAEYGFTVWHQKEGTSLNKKDLNNVMRSMRWDPSPMLSKNGWSVTVVGSSDYHSDLIVDRKMVVNNKQLFVLAIRFGTNEKILLKGWTSAKYIKLASNVTTKTHKAKNGREFTSTKYAMAPTELFPMSLLRGQLVKKSVIDQAEKDQLVMEAEKKDEFGF